MLANQPNAFRNLIRDMKYQPNGQVRSEELTLLLLLSDLE
jgi:hypothetical protein